MSLDVIEKTIHRNRRKEPQYSAQRHSKRHEQEFVPEDAQQPKREMSRLFPWDRKDLVCAHVAEVCGTIVVAE